MTDTAAADTTPRIAPHDRRVRVFVSSTLTELAAEREAVRAAITRLRLTPVMFELGARPHPPRELYRAYLAQSDVFVGIYGEQLRLGGAGERGLGPRGRVPALRATMPKLSTSRRPRPSVISGSPSSSSASGRRPASRRRPTWTPTSSAGWSPTTSRCCSPNASTRPPTRRSAAWCPRLCRFPRRPSSVATGRSTPCSSCCAIQRPGSSPCSDPAGSARPGSLSRWRAGWRPRSRRSSTSRRSRNPAWYPARSPTRSASAPRGAAR